MKLTNILNEYEEVKEELKFQITSNIRAKIMLCLSEGPKETGELQKFTGKSQSAILHAIKEFKKQDIILKEGDTFFLSEIGEISTLKLIDMIKTSISLKKFHKLWNNHKIKYIPQDLLRDIGDLSNSKLIESEDLDIHKPCETHKKIILNSKKVKGFIPVFHKDYIKIFRNILEKGVKVELILIESVLRKTIETDGINDLNKFISTGDLTIWALNEDVKITFTITNKFFSLCLFSTEGVYDSSKLLVSDHEDAIAWGNKLFDHYLKRAQKLFNTELILNSTASSCNNS